MIKDEIIKAIEKATRSTGHSTLRDEPSGSDSKSSGQAGLTEKDIILESPEREEFGDYSSNIAMTIFSKSKIKNQKSKFIDPKNLAKNIVEELQKDKKLIEIAERIEVAGPGFINFWLSKDALVDTLVDINTKKVRFGKSDFLKGRKYLIEHTSPNTIKTLHVGHVRNNVLGMAVHNILEFVGAEVKLDSINNDRGIHVMKAVWAYMKYGEGKTPKGSWEKPDHFVDKFYVRGAKEAENKEVKEEMQELLRKWESKDKEVHRVWKKLRDWTFEGFLETYKRLRSYHDQQWFESDFYQHGKEMIEEGLKKKVFNRLADGAVLSNLKKYALPDTIILRSDGTSMYHTQDLYLTKLKREKFPSNLYVWDIGPEQELYLKQLFAMCEQLGIGKRDDYFHMSYGFVYLKRGGKMSSRAGNVISADDLIDEVIAKASKINKEVAEVVGLAAIKYGFLKVARNTNIYFDIDESLSLKGNSGPYLQYTVARTQSVLRKVKSQNLKVKITSQNLKMVSVELSILRTLVHFPEVVLSAAEAYTPNIVCNYLYDLAQKFNNFYEKERIIGGENEEFRLRLTSAVGQVLKNGLNLLGIKAPKRM